MLPQDPMRAVVQGIILDNMTGKARRVQRLQSQAVINSSVVKPRNAEEAQVVDQAQQQAQQPNAELVAAQGY